MEAAYTGGMSRKILVVDDEEDLRRIVSRIVGVLGTVLQAADAAEALRVIEQEHPDLIVLDVTMPGVGGLELLKQVHEARPDMPVLMLTGRLEIATARDALEQGARAYMTKPFEPFALTQEVARLLGGKPDQAEDGGRPWRVREPWS